MPPQALANWNWGGREHPKYQALSMATKNVLGLGKLIARMVLLKPMDNTDDREKVWWATKYSWRNLRPR